MLGLAILTFSAEQLKTERRVNNRCVPCGSPFFTPTLRETGNEQERVGTGVAAQHVVQTYPRGEGSLREKTFKIGALGFFFLSRVETPKSRVR